MKEEETTVTRKYQITLPKRIREKFGIRIGDKLPITGKDGKITIEVGKIVQNPAEYLWNLSEKSTTIDAVKLIKRTRRRAYT
jgi:AbrB family looped-hinge helix DNA binding protein